MKVVLVKSSWSKVRIVEGIQNSVAQLSCDVSFYVQLTMIFSWIQRNTLNLSAIIQKRSHDIFAMFLRSCHSLLMSAWEPIKYVADLLILNLPSWKNCPEKLSYLTSSRDEALLQSTPACHAIRNHVIRGWMSVQKTDQVYKRYIKSQKISKTTSDWDGMQL